MTHLVVADRTAPGIDGDLSLVERARDGDRHAFDRLVAARLPQTYRLAKAITGHPGDAEDVTQEAFLQAWRNLPRLRSADRFDAWFGRILVNEARMALRRRSRVMTVSVDEIDVRDGDSSGYVPVAWGGRPVDRRHRPGRCPAAGHRPADRRPANHPRPASPRGTPGQRDRGRLRIPSVPRNGDYMKRVLLSSARWRPSDE